MDRSALTASRVRIGDCVIDRLQRTATNFSGTHRPRPKVFDVLIYLVDNRERVVSKEELFSALWSGTATTDDALVACIGEVRRLLGDDSRHARMVLTIPKKGYMLTGVIDAVEESQPVEIRAPRRRRAWWAVAGAVAVLAFGLALYWWPRGTGLVGWWRFDESGGRLVVDRSGYGNNGIIFNGLQRRRGPHGGALVFDGKGYVTGTGPGKSFPRGDAPFTISTWLNRTGQPLKGGSILQFGTIGWNPPRASALLGWFGKLSFGFGFGYKELTGNRNLADGLWHHVAGVYDAGKTRRMELFVDGESDAIGHLSEPADIRAGSPWAAGVNQGGGVPYEGMIADLRLYRRALTHPQVAAMYRCGLPVPDISLPGGRHGYYLPLYRATISALPRPEGAPAVPFVYDGYGRGGAEFAASDGVCALENLRGAGLGEDLRIGVEIRLPAATQAGPFFRARRVAPGDPIEAPGNGGYWVRLHSDGAVSVHSLNHPETQPNQPLAVSAAQPGFDGGQFHSVEVDVRAGRLRVRLDHARIEFPNGTTPGIPANGIEEGAAGIGFFVEGQPVDSIQARNVTVEAR